MDGQRGQQLPRVPGPYDVESLQVVQSPKQLRDNSVREVKRANRCAGLILTLFLCLGVYGFSMIVIRAEAALPVICKDVSVQCWNATWACGGQSGDISFQDVRIPCNQVFAECVVPDQYANVGATLWATHISSFPFVVNKNATIHMIWVSEKECSQGRLKEGGLTVAAVIVGGLTFLILAAIILACAPLEGL